jgi:hypothetical protein
MTSHLSHDDARTLVQIVASEADRTADEPMPDDAHWTRPGKTVTVATRLSPAHAAEIEQLAARLGVPVSALIRGWILAALGASSTQTVHDAVERLAADVERLREIVA